MPEGIVPELLIVAFFVLVLVGVVVLGRRDRVAEREQRKAAPEAPAATPVEAAPGEVTPVEDVAPPAPVAVEAVRERPSLRDRLAKSRKFLADRLADAFGRGADEETWDDLEAALIQADVGVEVAQRIVADLKTQARERRVTEPEELRALLAEELVSLFDVEQERTLAFASEGVTVWLVAGVNGTGKTTTIGKLAAELRSRGRSVALAAADTFRAAADEQLGVWATRAGAEVVKHQPGADPGAVVFDALQHTRAKGTDVLIVDTAGRLHTKTPLMDELGKVRRIIEREGQIHEALLVIDATAGQNGLVQAREFSEAAGVTGVVLTKMDGTAKGGIVLAIEKTLGIPIKLIGVGEQIDDLEPFDPKTFVDALLS